MKKPAIPAVPTNLPGDHHGLLVALKENVEIVVGVRSTKIDPLPTTATLADVIVAVNKIIDRLTPGA